MFAKKRRRIKRKFTGNARRSFGRRRPSPETVFWVYLLLILVVAGSGLVAYEVLFGSWGMAYSEQNIIRPLEDEETEVKEEATRVEWIPKTPVSHVSILLLGLDNHGMCDAIMIVSYDMETYAPSLISIKRDTYVPGQTWAAGGLGQDHIAWANYRGMGSDKDFHAGAGLTAYTVEELLGIDLHAYAAITFDGFVELIDLIGGVTVTVAPGFAGLENGALPTGLQHLSGTQALTYARHRQNPRISEPGSTSEDGDRVRRNQDLVRAILDRGKDMETDNILEMVDKLENSLFTSLEDWDILELANVMYNNDPEMLQAYVLPGEGEELYQEHVNANIYYYFLDFEETDSILQELGLK